MRKNYNREVKFFKYDPIIIALSACVAGYWFCKNYRDEKFYISIAMLCVAIPYIIYSAIKEYKTDPIKVEISILFISFGICILENNFLSDLSAIFMLVAGVRILLRLYKGFKN